MSLGLLGTKIGMTREFLKNGQSVPVTVIRVEKGRVLDVITKETRGYSAVKAHTHTCKSVATHTHTHTLTPTPSHPHTFTPTPTPTPAHSHTHTP